KTATNPPAPNANRPWPDTRHAGHGSRPPSGKRPRHEDSGKTRQKEGTAMIDTQVKAKFDQYGRYVLPDPETGEERAWTRATTIANTLADRFGLEQWAKRNVVLGIAAREDLYALAVSCKPEDKDQLNQIAAAA